MAAYRVLTWDPVEDIDMFADLNDFKPTEDFAMFWRLRKICPTRRHAISFVREMERQAYDRQCSILVERIDDVPFVH